MLYRPLTLKDSRTHDLRLMNWCRRVLRALEFKCGTFHIEVKVNGPEIHLLEVNPRPGGGANVMAIRLLSGVDLNQECLRLWAGVPRPPREQPRHLSICFAVRYPSIIGHVRSIRNGGTLGRLRTSAGTVLEWHPFVATGDRLDPREREQYLGVLIAPDFCKAMEDMDSATWELANLVHRPSFVQEEH
jgi:biotin carboxylase